MSFKRSNLIAGFAFIILFSFQLRAQDGSTYITTGGEWIFSGGGTSDDGAIRFSPVFNFQVMWNKDLNEKMGFFTGGALRNIGFIYDDPDNPTVRFKFRTYNVGVPIGIKFGDMNGAFLYGGYEIEMPVNYKQKTFVNEKKEDKFNVWFSDRVPTFYHSLFAGFQFYRGLNLKFKYYLNDFHNRDFVARVNGVDVKPYENLASNVWYISLNFSLFKNKEFYYKKVDSDMSFSSIR